MHSLPRRAAAKDQDLVWRTLVGRQIDAVRRGMGTDFLLGLDRAGLEPTRMPTHGALSRRLHALCGWRIETVPGLIPVRDFFALVRDRRFPSPEWIRHPDDLEYTPAPDAFHDLFGHVPQLASPAYADVLAQLADSAKDADDARLDELERVYWFTIEFGLVRETQGLRAMGAGLASSIAELERALRAPGVRRRAFDVRAAGEQRFENDRPQEIYFVVPVLAELAGSIASDALARRRRAG